MMELDNIEKLNIPYKYTNGIFEGDEGIPIIIVDFYVNDLSIILMELNKLSNIRYNKFKYLVEEISVKDIYNNRRLGYIIT
jgi:hypothetical protein